MKALGAAIIVIAAGLWGISSHKKQKADYLLLCDFYKLISALSLRISSRRQELMSVYSDLSGDNEAAKILSQTNGDYREIAEMLPQDLKSACEEFGSQIGGSFAKEQIRLCEDFLLILAEKKEQMRENIEKKLPLYRSLWLIAALCTAIILM